MERGIDSTGSDGVESNMLLCVFHREVSGDGFKAAFRDHGERGSNARNRAVSQRCSHGDDAAAGLLCLHLFDRELSDVNEAR